MAKKRDRREHCAHCAAEHLKEAMRIRAMLPHLPEFKREATRHMARIHLTIARGFRDELRGRATSLAKEVIDHGN